MKIIFIIGGIGSGKSSVVKLLTILGAKHINLDTVGHSALEDKMVIKDLVSAFGNQILDAQGNIDRRSLAGQAFLSQENVLQLDRVTFPIIAKLLKAQLREVEAETPDAVVAVEASSYDPTRLEFEVQPDILVAVAAPEEVRIERAIKAGFEEGDARRRSALQPTDAERKAWADHVIENGTSFEDLQHQVALFWDTVRAG